MQCTLKKFKGYEITVGRHQPVCTFKYWKTLTQKRHNLGMTVEFD